MIESKNLTWSDQIPILICEKIVFVFSLLMSDAEDETWHIESSLIDLDIFQIGCCYLMIQTAETTDEIGMCNEERSRFRQTVRH